MDANLKREKPADMLRVEAAYCGGEIVGLRITADNPEDPLLIWADNSFMKGFRVGKEFVAGWGEKTEYRDVVIGEPEPAAPAAPQGTAKVNWWEADGDKYDDSITRAQPDPTAQAEPAAGAWIERWYGSGGKDGYEGWSIVNKDDRGLVAYLGRNVESGAVTEIVMAHNATLASPTAQAAPVEWDGKLPTSLQRCLNALRLECPPAVVNGVEHEVRSTFEALHTTLATTKRMYGAARDRLEAVEAAQAAPAGADVRRSDLVPGVMHCAKCKFQLNRVTLCVSDGNAYAGDNKTEPCPNGCGPLWPVTWEQEARNCWKTLEEMHERLQAAPAAGAVVGPDLQPLHNLLYLAQRQNSLGAMRCAITEARLELAKVRDEQKH